jgi:hypothetical protein
VASSSCTGNHCCSPLQGACSVGGVGGDCCGGEPCNDVGGGVLKCCRPADASCSSGPQCCSGICRPNSTCQ